MARRVVAFGAHPDDLEVGCGGLLARLASEGSDVTMVVSSIPNLFETRVDEARRGAEILGGHLVFAQGEQCIRVDDIPMYELVARYDRILEEHAPDLVLTHIDNDLHSDHYRVHRATISAMRNASCDLLAFSAQPDLSAKPRRVGTFFADITSTIDVKLESLRAHASQIGPTTIDSRRDMARAIGRTCGATYAEAFEVLRLRI